MVQEIETQFAHKAVLKSNQVLDEMGFKPQVHARPINLFYIEKGKRERLIDENDQISITGLGTFSKAEMIQKIQEMPERFSPNVVLRPVYQECILPNLAYVGGGGEMAYWLQFKGVFEAASVPFPLIQVRNSLQLIDANSQKKLTKLGIKTSEIFHELDELKKKFILENSGEALDFSLLDEAVKALETQIQKSILDVDASLNGFASAEIVKLQKQIEHIQAKLIKQQKAKFDGAMKQLEDVKEKLFPQNGVQERKDNFFSFCASGDVFPFLDLLKDAIDPLEKDLIVVILD
jgi:bacillithiol biosynthesis cysteine-adding enzyme BshC